MNVEPKNTKKLNAKAKANNARETKIAREWLSFSQTEAYRDLMLYGHSTSDMLTAYAKEGVMPSPIKNGEDIILTNEKAISLLQNARGCDIILSYAEEYISSAANK